MRNITALLKRKSISIALFVCLILTATAAIAAPQSKKFKDRSAPEQQNPRRQLREERQRERLENKSNRQLMNDSFFGGGMEARLWVRVLKLNTDQIQRIQQIRRRSIDDYLSLEGQIREKRKLLDQAIYRESFNEEEVKQLAGELARLEGQRVLMRTRIQSQMRLLLSPEQIRLLNDIRSGLLPLPPADGKPDPEEDPEEK